MSSSELEQRPEAAHSEGDESQESMPTIPAPVAGAGGNRQFVAYTVKLPADELAALQSIWLELKRLYGTHSPDKSGMIQQAIASWLKRWDSPERDELLRELLEIREDTRRRQYRKD